MTVVSMLQVFATKGEPVTAETVGGVKVEVVEFFDPDDLGQDGSGITFDIPFDYWTRMGEPTEMTVSLVPGDITEDHNL